MPENALVTICYGPYESNGVVGYKIFRLQGLQGMFPLIGDYVVWPLPVITEVKHRPSNLSAAALTARGHRCILEATHEWNTVELVVNGLVVFSCCIKQLQFGECVTLVCCKRAMFVTVQFKRFWFPLKAEMDNWTLSARRLWPLWMTLTEDLTSLLSC